MRTNKPKAKSRHPTSSISLEDWKAFYDIAGMVAAFEPWHDLTEDQVFAIQPASTPDAEITFVSVMGTLGQHHAVALYTGGTALGRLHAAETQESAEASLDLVLGTDQLQVEFSDSQSLDKHE